MSVSTEQGDFLFIDKSLAAVRSVSLGGVGGNGSVVMGRGPMLIKLHDGNGHVVFIVESNPGTLTPAILPLACSVL